LKDKIENKSISYEELKKKLIGVNL
jgi:hypothetical protein